MIKPIVYNNIEEKNALEEKMIAGIPLEARKSASIELMNIFYKPANNTPPKRTAKLRLK